jgi:hypothetical protein
VNELPVLLIFHISYVNKLDDEEVDKIFLFKYEKKSQHLAALIGDDYKKVYPLLVEYFKVKEKQSYINDYLKGNPPENSN